MAKVSVSLFFRVLTGLRIYIFSQLTRRTDFAVKYGGRWAG